MGGSLPGSAHHLLTMVMRLSVDVHPAPWLLLDVYLGFRDLERNDSLGLRVVRNMPDSCFQLPEDIALQSVGPGRCHTVQWSSALTFALLRRTPE